MTTNLLLGFPNIPFSGSPVYVSETEATGYEAENLACGGRTKEFKLSAATTNPLLVEWDFGSSTTATFFAVLGAKKLKASGCNTVQLFGSAYRYNHPSTLSGLKLWLDATKEVTFSSNLISAWGDQSGNNYDAAQSNNTLKFSYSRPDNVENWALYSDDFTQSNWTKTACTVTSNATVNPIDWATTADKIIPSVANTLHYFYQDCVRSDTGLVRASIYLKQAGYTRAYVYFEATGAFGTVEGVNVNLSTGAIVGQNANVSNVSYTLVAEDWYKLTFDALPSGTGTCRLQTEVRDNSGNATYAGDGTSGIYVSRACVNTAGASSSSVQTTSYAIYRGINGKNCVRFTDQDAMDLSNPSGLKISTDIDIFIALQPQQEPTTRPGVIIYAENLNANGYKVGMGDGSNRKIVYRTNQAGANTSLTSSSSLSNYVPSVVEVYRSGGTATININGSAAGSGAISNPVDQTFYYIGHDSAGSTFIGGIGEILIFNRALTSGERTEIQAYLDSKWRNTPPAFTANLDLETLVGTEDDIFIEYFTETSSLRYWQVWYGATQATKYPQQKTLFGKALDFGRDPLCTRKIRSSQDKDKRRGNYEFTFEWHGITSTLRDQFEDYVAQYKNEVPVLLFTDSYHWALGNQRAIYCTLENYNITAEPAQVWTISANFKEVL